MTWDCCSPMHNSWMKILLFSNSPACDLVMYSYPAVLGSVHGDNLMSTLEWTELGRAIVSMFMLSEMYGLSFKIRCLENTTLWSRTTSYCTQHGFGLCSLAKASHVNAILVLKTIRSRDGPNARLITHDF